VAAIHHLEQLSEREVAMAEPTSRSLNGVVVSLVKQEDGALRVVVDEVTADREGWPQRWTSRVFLTLRDFPAHAVVENRLSEQELAELGEFILAYLSAKLSPRSST
jgi:hypothetical protein